MKKKENIKAGIDQQLNKVSCNKGDRWKILKNVINEVAEKVKDIYKKRDGIMKIVKKLSMQMQMLDWNAFKRNRTKQLLCEEKKKQCNRIINVKKNG